VSPNRFFVALALEQEQPSKEKRPKGMNVTCEWDDLVSPALDRVKAEEGRVLVLVCDKGDREVHVEREEENVALTADDLREKIEPSLVDGENRFIVYHYALTKDHAHHEALSTASILWIHWSPGQGVPVSHARMYSATKERMRVNMDDLREVTLSDRAQFSPDWIVEKAARLNK
jgi:Cofilin/tropomyosin-type actin-binding protein